MARTSQSSQYVDRKGIDAVRKVFTERDVQNLPIYIDRSSEALRTVRAIGLPSHESPTDGRYGSIYVDPNR